MIKYRVTLRFQHFVTAHPPTSYCTPFTLIFFSESSLKSGLTPLCVTLLLCIQCSFHCKHVLVPCINKDWRYQVLKYWRAYTSSLEGGGGKGGGREMLTKKTASCLVLLRPDTRGLSLKYSISAEHTPPQCVDAVRLKVFMITLL